MVGAATWPPPRHHCVPHAAPAGRLPPHGPLVRSDAPLPESVPHPSLHEPPPAAPAQRPVRRTLSNGGRAWRPHAPPKPVCPAARRACHTAVSQPAPHAPPPIPLPVAPADQPTPPTARPPPRPLRHGPRCATTAHRVRPFCRAPSRSRSRSGPTESGPAQSAAAQPSPPVLPLGIPLRRL